MATRKSAASKAKGTKKTRKIEPHPLEERFEFDSHAGTVTLPWIENIPMEVLEDAEENCDTAGEQVKYLLDELMDKASREVRRKMTLGEFREMTDRWNEESSISLGE